MSYDARKRELIDELAKQEYEPAKASEYTPVLENYCAQRERWLDDLTRLLEPSEENNHGRWLEACKVAAAGAQDAISKGRESIWLAKISNEEHTFFFNLMRSQVPVQRDLMVQQTKALQIAEKEFEAKWNAIREADNAIEDRMKRIASEFETILNEAAKYAASAEMESKEALRAKVKIAATALDLGIVSKVLSGAITFFQLKRNAAAERRLEIHALISREEGVLTAFKEAREMVQAFLEETSYVRVKDAFDVGEDAAEALAGQMLTNGQKDDANAYSATLKEELEDVFAKAEEAYKNFARKHEYLFFGPLGGGYHQELAEGDYWKDFSSRWRDSRRDLDDVLRERVFEVSDSDVLEVSLDGLTSEDKARIRQELEKYCRDLLQAWNSFKEEFPKDPEWVLESREQLTSILEAMRSG